MPAVAPAVPISASRRYRPQGAPAERWVSKQEFADRHGVSIATIERWIKAGMPSVKRGKHKQSPVAIPLQSADVWLRNRDQ